MAAAPQKEAAPQKDLLARLAEAADAALRALSDAPGAERIAAAGTAARDRVDELQRRVLGLESLEKRIAALERKVDRLAKGSPAPKAAPARKATATKASGVRK